MTDELPFGLGAIEDDPDERDYPIDALYEAEGITTDAASLPSSYIALGMPPVLDQGSSPRCVAYGSAAMKGWQDRKDQLQFFDFDEALFFSQIGGTANGAQPRAAMQRLLDYGYPEQGGARANLHRITAYYAVPPTYDDIRQAILAFGPVGFSTRWYRSWFHPHADGTLPAPDTQVGRHFITAYGWDGRGLRLRNSWGTDWGLAGDCYLPAAYVNEGGTSAAWKTVDVIEHPVAYSHVVKVTAKPSLRIRKSPNTAAAKIASVPAGRLLSTTQLERYGGKYAGPDGKPRTDWLQVKTGSGLGWVARAYTGLVK